MVQLTLEQAKAVISSRTNFTKTVEWIQFEDGSGRSFNYRFKGELQNKYIRF